MSTYKSDSKSTSTPSGENGFKQENQKKGKGISHSHVPSDISLRVKALETVLSQKKIIDPEALDKVVDRYQNQVGPQNGAKIVAKAWMIQIIKNVFLRTVLLPLLNSGCSGSRESIWLL